MIRVILPATCMIVYLGTRVGPNDIVTGSVAVGAIMMGVISYLGCCLTDWLSVTPALPQSAQSPAVTKDDQS